METKSVVLALIIVLLVVFLAWFAWRHAHSDPSMMLDVLPVPGLIHKDKLGGGRGGRGGGRGGGWRGGGWRGGGRGRGGWGRGGWGGWGGRRRWGHWGRRGWPAWWNRYYDGYPWWAWWEYDPALANSWVVSEPGYCKWCELCASLDPANTSDMCKACIVNCP